MVHIFPVFRHGNTVEWVFNTELLQRHAQKVIGRSQNSKDKLSQGAGLAALKAVELTEDDAAGKLLDLLRNYAIYAPNTPTLRGLEPDPQSREPVGLAGGRLPEGVQTLRHNHKISLADEFMTLVDWLQSYGISSTYQLPISASVPQQQRALRFRDRFMSEGRNTLSGYDASEGVLYLLFCTVLALHPKMPRLFAIDNFDQALNPRTARDFTRKFCKWLLNSQDRQVLLTTHNPLVLDGLPLRDERVRLFAVDRSKRGQTVINRVVVNDALLDAAENGIPLSQQWVMGSFGGVPVGV